MRTTSITSAAATGPSNWVPIDNNLFGFGLTLNCTITSGATITYKVQYTSDRIDFWQPCNITRSGTTATLKLQNHGISGTTDSIVVRGTGDSNLDGVYTVASIADANTITYTVANTGATLAANTAEVVVLRVFDHATITGKTANQDGNIAFPVTAVRLNVTAWTSGKVTMTLNEGRK
jgi:hypothetical protein